MEICTLPLCLIYLTVSVGGDLYAATVADFSGSDSLIIKNQLRTEQYDFKHLNGKYENMIIFLLLEQQSHAVFRPTL